MKLIDDFLGFVAQMATVSHSEMIDAIPEGDSDKYCVNLRRTCLLIAVANIDGKDRWAEAHNQVIEARTKNK